MSCCADVENPDSTCTCRCCRGLCGCTAEEAEYDADELGLDPEEDVQRSIYERAARNLMNRPRYPGEIVED